MNSVKLTLVTFAITLFASACTTTTDRTAQTGTQPSPAASPAGAANATNTPPADEFAATRVIYAQQCVMCHGGSGDGGVVKVEDKRLKVPSFKVGHALKHTDEEFVKQVTDGGDGMPAFKDRLTQEEIADLVRFIRREFQGGAAKTKEAPPAAPKS